MPCSTLSQQQQGGFFLFLPSKSDFETGMLVRRAEEGVGLGADPQE